jgi:adenylate cyclase
LERKLAAILCADVYGYSRLMGEDEEATLRTLTSHRKLIDSAIDQHYGRFVNSAGDSVLAEFASVVEAVNCAVEIQTGLKTQNASIPAERRMEFRIGVNLGDVMVEGAQIYGDGVNVAARLESLAEPGGICISGTAHDQVRDKLAIAYEDAGEQTVKNIARPVHVWRVLLNGATPAPQERRRFARKQWRRGLLSLAGLAIIVGTIVLVQHLSLKPQTTDSSIPPGKKPALSLPDIPSIAVLPFTNLSGDPQQEYFSDGISDDVITALSKLPNLFVIARNSTFTYKGKAVKVQEVSRELGVKYVLEGSVRKADNQVRITAQLVDATTGDHLWAEHYDRPLREIFALQDDIVRRIVTTMNLQLAVVEGPRITRRTDNPDAYDYFLRGFQFFNLTREGDAKARQLLEKAIELDPNYSDAYQLLGYIQYMEMISQLSRDPHGFDRGIQLEQKSIALDNSNASAYAILSEFYTVTGQYDLSISAVRHALALEPNSALGYSALALILCLSGKPAEAIVAAQKATRLDPGGRDYYAAFEGMASLFMGRYQEAIPLLKRALARYPTVVSVHLHLIICYVELGRNELARAEAREVMRLNPELALPGPKKDPFNNLGGAERFDAELRKAGLK